MSDDPEAIRLVNKLKMFVEIAMHLKAQDEFTYSEDAPLEVQQAYNLLNAFRRMAIKALEDRP